MRMKFKKLIIIGAAAYVFTSLWIFGNQVNNPSGVVHPHYIHCKTDLTWRFKPPSVDKETGVRYDNEDWCAVKELQVTQSAILKGIFWPLWAPFWAAAQLTK